MKNQDTKHSVAKTANVRVIVANSTGARSSVKQASVSPVKAITYEGCSCWAHN
jgi:hypothetical protein